ncbi:MAG: YbaB/EbfC family nucleoid-associated protein [Legionellales bacterium]|nr:YbaB/EbfC family nucleoid-associated protein [Legionellales bacterium]
MMKPDIKQLMEQAQKMQQNMQKAQQELAAMLITGQAGGGLVKVVMNGRHEAKSCHIDYSLMDDDKDVLEDLIVAAINDAVNQIEKRSQEKIVDLTSGLELPAEFKIPGADDSGRDN